MKSLKTRVATTALAGAMALSLAAPAFAAAPATKITAAYKEIVIDVTVPATGTVTLNPMAMPVELAAESSAGAKDGVSTEKGQIVTAPLYIQNNTNVDLKVGASVATTVKGNLTFSETGWAVGSE